MAITTNWDRAAHAEHERDRLRTALNDLLNHWAILDMGLHHALAGNRTLQIEHINGIYAARLFDASDTVLATATHTQPDIALINLVTPYAKS